MTVAEDLNKKTRCFPKVRWGAISREAIEKEVEKLDLMGKLLAKSNLTEKEAEVLGHKIMHAMGERFGYAPGR
jgi:hypothetical protein